MKKYLYLMLVLAVVFTFACESSQPRTEAAPEEPQVSSGGGMFVSMSNQALLPAAEALDVFPPSSSRLSSKNKAIIGQKAVAIVSEIINKLPEGYVIQVTGHSALIKDEATDSVSTRRARGVYKALVGGGLDASKLTYKGIGTSEMLEGLDGKDPKQRRVTFKVVPK